jgi:hypothetical protein
MRLRLVGRDRSNSVSTALRFIARMLCTMNVPYCDQRDSKATAMAAPHTQNRLYRPETLYFAKTVDFVCT